MNYLLAFLAFYNVSQWRCSEGTLLRCWGQWMGFQPGLEDQFKFLFCYRHLYWYCHFPLYTSLSFYSPFKFAIVILIGIVISPLYTSLSFYSPFKFAIVILIGIVISPLYTYTSLSFYSPFTCACSVCPFCYTPFYTSLFAIKTKNYIPSRKK